MNAAALDEAVSRFPRVLAECDLLERNCRFFEVAPETMRKIVDRVWRWFLETEPRTVEAITHEYHLISGGMP